MRIEDENIMPEMLGKSIGQYQLLELIGKGDTSFVYKAFQPAMGRYVAVKVLFPFLVTSPEFMEQFQRRLSRVASLQHNNILPVYDYGQEDNVLYVVTRYVEEGTLEDYLPDYYSPRAALRIIQPVADALDYAYARGLVHANLKPENILIDDEQRALLTDFDGLRQEAVTSQRLSPYHSPEQRAGAPLDQRSDVYGLGALLYTLLIGEPPAIDQVPIPRAHRPGLAPAIEKIILKAMAATPQQRFQSAGELSRALQRALREEGAPAPQPTTSAEPEPVYIPAPEQQQESRGLTGLIYIFGVLALLAAVVAVYFVFFDNDDLAVAPTAAPGVPMVTATSDVNVRSGPGTAYEVVGVMRAGQSAEAIGVSPDGGWWVIRFPVIAGGSGWVSGRFTSATDTGNLPIVQPPRLPTGEPQPTATSDEIAGVPTLPAEESAPEELPQEPPAEEGQGLPLCGAPALLLLFGLVLMVPARRRRP